MKYLHLAIILIWLIVLPCLGQRSNFSEFTGISDLQLLSFFGEEK